MNVEQLREYCLSLGEVEEKMPFDKFARRYDSLLVFYVCGHMFCIVDLNEPDYVDVRSTPDEKEEIMQNHTAAKTPFNPAMKFWLEIKFGGDISDAMILTLISRAYDIIKDKYTKIRK